MRAPWDGPPRAARCALVDPTADVDLRADRRRPLRRALRRLPAVGLAPVPRSRTGGDRDQAGREAAPTTAEHRRLAEATGRAEDDLFAANPWYEWGPVPLRAGLGHRAGGLQRRRRRLGSFPHDHARSRAYRWNEDGMAGISDIHHDLCLALALWNGADPILKERMFGLTGPQGNHGEDAKEYWWYLDGLPSHALLQWRYHYPQAAFPYEQLVERERPPRPRRPRVRAARHRRVRRRPLLGRRRHLRQGVAHRRGRGRSPSRTTAPDEAELHVLPDAVVPQHVARGRRATRRSRRSSLDGDAIAVDHPRLGGYRLEAGPAPGRRAPRRALFCDNETNTARLFGADDRSARSRRTASTTTSSPAPTRSTRTERGTKAAWWYRLTVPGGGRAELRLRLHRPTGAGRRTRSGRPSSTTSCAGGGDEADEFYAAIAPAGTDAERMQVLRQACAGLVWSKQIYPYRVGRWLDGDPGQPPPPPGHRSGRNAGWRHLDAFDVLAMPDPWEYPWFAAWDLAFHAVAVGPPRPRVRQVPAARAAAGVVPAPQRRAARVRVELRRREPARPRPRRASGCS